VEDRERLQPCSYSGGLGEAATLFIKWRTGRGCNPVHMVEDMERL
jgi:hypothetical protein